MEYPRDWRLKTLEKISIIASGGTPSRKINEYWDGEIPWVTTTLIQNNIINSAIEFISEKGLQNSSAKFLPKGTILMAMYGQGKTRGRVAILGIDAAINQACASISVKEEIFTKYLFYFLNYKYHFIRELSNSGGQENLSSSIIKELKVPIPSLLEQQKIAAILSKWDELIETQTQLIAAKEKQKTSLMQKLLTGEVRFPGFEDEWEEKTLREVCDVRDGTHESPKYQNSGVKFITSKNIKNGALDFKEINYITELDAINFNKRSKVEYGDILMSMIGTIGNSVLIDFEPDFCVKNVGLIKPKDIEGKYLIQFFHSDYFQKYISSQLDGGIQKFISLGGLRYIKLLCPTKAEQAKIADSLSIMDDEIQTLRGELEAIKLQKKGLMQQLLTGKIRVKV